MAYPDTPVGTGGPYANAGRGADKFAAALMQGLQTGQQMRGAALQQQLTQNQLDEYGRTQALRRDLGAVAPEDYAGQARVYQQAGDTAQAGAALERDRTIKERMRKERAMAGLQAAFMGDSAKAVEILNEIHGKAYPIENAGGKLSLQVPTGKVDAQGNQILKRRPLQNSEIFKALAAAGGPELLQVLSLDQKDREMEQNRAAIKLAYGRGGANGDYKLEAETDKGVPIYRLGDQQYVPNPQTGKLVPYTGGAYDRIRYLGREAQQASADPVRDRIVDSIKSDPENGYAMLQQYDQNKAREQLAAEFHSVAAVNRPTAIANAMRDINAVRDPKARQALISFLGITPQEIQKAAPYGPALMR